MKKDYDRRARRMGAPGLGGPEFGTLATKVPTVFRALCRCSWLARDVIDSTVKA